MILVAVYATLRLNKNVIFYFADHSKQNS